MEFPSKTLSVNDIAMHLVDVGEGEPVLLMHGFPDTHAVWRYQIPELVAAGYRVIAPDTRGCGATQMPRRVSDYHRDILVADMLALLDELHIDKVKLIGHDWGAVQGWLFALAHPERVERYIALSVGHPAAYGRGGWRQKLKGWYVLMFQLRGLAEVFIKAGNWLFFRKFTGFPSEWPHWQRALSQPGRLTAGINYYRANLGLVLPKAWPKARVPVYGLVSTEDRFLTVEQMQQSVEFVDGPFHCEVIEGANHWLQLDEPEQINEALLKFLAEEVQP